MSLCRIVDCAKESSERFLAERKIESETSVRETVEAILRDVRVRGDAAVLEIARRFDAPDLQTLKVSSGEIDTAVDALPKAHLAALELAARRIREFHEAQLAALTRGWSKIPGGWGWSIDAETGHPCTYGVSGSEGQRWLPLARVGGYVPGGKASYPSSVLMNLIPAQVAGVQDLCFASPARPDGTLPPSVLAAAHIAGVREIYKIGGAAAITAMALGTETIQSVQKIVGPGNAYVNEAKRQLWGQVGLDQYAGPSEVCVLIDETANPEWAAADWLTQVEHSEDNAGFLIALSREALQRTIEAAERQIEDAPRGAVLQEALRRYGAAFLCTSMEEACTLVDALAPEHLTLMVERPEDALARIRNSGCILVGDYTPQSAGDFVSGPSHTLPTATGARFGSPLNVLDFLKVQSIGRLSEANLRHLTLTIEAFGEMEGFPAHARGATIRWER